MQRHGNEQGFVLASAILAMVVVGAAVTAGYFVANQEYRIGKSMKESQKAFYAAQAGLDREYGLWPVAARWNGMKGGDSVTLGPVTLASGVSYRGVAVRLDNSPKTDTNTERYYLIRMTGAAPAPLLGEEVRSTQAMMLRVRYYDFCCTAAITAKDHLQQAGNSTVDGGNTTPVAWAGQCDSANTAPGVSGVEVECDTCYSKQGNSSTLAGSPPLEVDTTLKSKNLIDWDEVTWNFLKSKATKTYADGETVTNTVPATTPDPVTLQPTCNQSLRSNWGEPTNPLHPCFNYFPIIYAQGSLSIQSSAYGQGILLVEGDLRLNGGYSFYGVVIVRGHVQTEGTAGKIWGSLVVAGQNTGTLTSSRLAGAASVRYSACAAQRAKQWADLNKKQPLDMRAWVESLN